MVPVKLFSYNPRNLNLDKRPCSVGMLSVKYESPKSKDSRRVSWRESGWNCASHTTQCYEGCEAREIENLGWDGAVLRVPDFKGFEL